jgi:CO/xanthine dehydrogenase Mo-binding subunit
VYPLRRELSTLLGMDPDRVVVRHADGPGCYGHNCADDAAALAAIAAIAVRPAPVRLQLTMEDELAWEPFGSAMLADLEAGLDRAGRITSWRHRARTDAHSSRPNGAGDRLIPAWLVSGGRPRSWPGPHDNGTRNSVPLYDLPAMECVTDFVRGPLRTSALRSLAAHHNVFAIESFMDELAEVAGSDPVAFRLAHLSDERARAVLDAACSAAGWETHVGPSGRGQGVAVCRYKGTKAYVAAVIDAAMHPETGRIRVDRVILACDAGVVVNPDGLRNQLEGGVVQGLSRALFEQVSADGRGVRSRDWTSYPVLRFADVPRVEVLLLDGRGHPPVGAGEAATPPVAPALANALDDAVGIRMRTLPLTAEQAQQRLAEMSDEEMARVVLA